MATTAATTRLKGAALTLQNSHWPDLLVSSSPLSSLHPSLCAAPARPYQSPPSPRYVTRCWCRLRLPGTHFYTRGCHSILDLGSPRAHPRNPVLVRLWRIVSSPSLGPSGWNSESDQWATRIDDSISTTSRYPFFIAKAPPRRCQPINRRLARKAPYPNQVRAPSIVGRGNGEFGCRRGIGSPSIIPPTTVKVPRATQPTCPGRVPYHRRSSVPCRPGRCGHRDCPKPTLSLHGPADPGFTIPPQGPSKHRSVPLKGAVFRTLPSNGTLANAPPRASLRDPLPPNPGPLIRPKGSLQRPPGRVRTSLGVHLHRELPPFAEVPSLLAPPALVVAFLRASLLY